VITDHSGKFVYIPNTADATLSAFTLDSSGTLTEISGSPFPSGGNGSINGPTGITTDFAGQFIYVCNASNDISVFKIDKSTGELSPVTGSPFAERGSGPHGIVFVHRP
jgi:DNA-binding beta-propeller fold protein YncE